MRRSQIRRALWKVPVAIALAVAWLVLGVVAARTLTPDRAAYRDRVGEDVDAQHAFLGRRLRGGPLPARTMLTHTIYGFSLVDTVLLAPLDEARRRNAVRELRFLIERLDDPALRSRYADTQVPNGVYYLSQKNLLLAGLLRIDPAPETRHVEAFHATSRTLFDAFETSPIAHLESYPGHVWPCDNVAALASLAVHDRLYGTRYGGAMDRWLEAIGSALDPATGLMPSKLDPATGAAAAPPRGSAGAYALIFLSDLAPAFARDQYRAFQAHHHAWRGGLVGVRAYPRGTTGPVGVDAGLMVAGIAAGASGLGLVAARAMGDRDAHGSLMLTAELMGVPYRWRRTKRYLGGRLPIVDAVVSWGKTRVSWIEAAPLDPPVGADPGPGRFRRTRLLGLLAAGAVLLGVMSVRLCRGGWPWRQGRSV